MTLAVTYVVKVMILSDLYSSASGAHDFHDWTVAHGFRLSTRSDFHPSSPCFRGAWLP